MAIDWTRLRNDEQYRDEVIVTLMQSYNDTIAQYCVARLGEGIGEEITQEVFVTAWERLPTFRPEASLRSWLFGIASKKCQQYYRNRVRRRALDRAFMGDIRQ